MKTARAGHRIPPVRYLLHKSCHTMFCEVSSDRAGQLQNRKAQQSKKHGRNSLLKIGKKKKEDSRPNQHSSHGRVNLHVTGSTDFILMSPTEAHNRCGFLGEFVQKNESKIDLRVVFPLEGSRSPQGRKCPTNGECDPPRMGKIAPKLPRKWF